MPPAKNSSTTATITIKPERLAHLCVEQAFLYPWMYCTLVSYCWFELYRSQDEHFSTPYIYQNASATAIITIKPERLTHSCVEQVFLYAWTCYTSWFELHISQDKHFNSYYLATILLYQPVRIKKIWQVTQPSAPLMSGSHFHFDASFF